MWVCGLSANKRFWLRYLKTSSLNEQVLRWMLVDQWKGYLVFVLPLKPVSQEEISEMHGEHN